MRITARVNPGDPAVAAVIVRRVVGAARAAVSVRRSRAASLRTRPTLMPRMPSTRTMPKIVAASMICASDGMLLRVSTLIPDAPAASWRALVTCAAVRPFGTVMSQPAVVIEPCRRSVAIACSVNTVFGAEVPDGSWLTSWIDGLATQERGGQGEVLLLLGHGGLLGGRIRLLVPRPARAGGVSA